MYSESVFSVGSVHKGTITSSSDKGMVVALPYGVEGFAPLRHVVKAAILNTEELFEFSGEGMDF